MGKFLLSVLLSVSCLIQVYANTSLGGELYYKYVSSLKYEVTIVFYRDCQSAPFGTDLGLYSIQCSSSSKVFNRTGKHLWFLDGQRTEEDQPSVAINGREGFFSAIYVDRFGCESDTSSGVEILLGVENLTADQIRVYPNPSSGRVMIEGLAIGTIKQVKLFDAQGRVVNRELDISRSTAELRWVSSPGVYVVEVTTDLSIFRKTIIQE